MAATKQKSLAEKLSTIQAEFKAEKGRFNSFGKYKYRSAEDILEALKPLNEKHKVFFTNSEEFLSGGVIVSTATIHDVESEATISAKAIVGVDFEQKGMQVPQAFGSASSYGKKYAFGNLLLIDDTADADATNTHGKTSSAAKKKLTAGSDEFTSAVKYVKGGGSIAAIEKKYDMTPAVKSKLEKESA